MYPDGTLDVDFDGVSYFTRLVLPVTQAIEGAAYGFGAATGGLNANHFIDDLTITTQTGPVRAGFLHQPQSAAFLLGAVPRFYTSLANTSEEVVFGYQWERQALDGGSFVPVPGATEPNFVGSAGVTAADNGAKYRLAVYDQGRVTYSDEVTLTVINFPEPAYQYTETFSSANPAGTLYGTAMVDTVAGELVLTTADNSQAGSFIIDDLNAGQAVAGFTVAFDLQMSQSDNDPPNVVVADGLSFNWAPDVEEAAAPSTGSSEDGSRSGLRLCFDVYDNVDGNPYNVVGEAPAIELCWGNEVLASVRVMPAELNTGAAFVPVLVNLAPEGTVSVAVNGRFYFLDVPVPNWTASSLAKYAFYARTGGANQKHAIANVRIAPVPYEGQVALVAHPQPVTTVVGQTATFTVGANFAVPPATVIWQRKRANEAVFSDIPGAAETTFTTEALTAEDDGSLYRAVVRLGAGNEATSEEALLTVLNFSHTAPQVVLNFNGNLTNTGSAAEVVPTATIDGTENGEPRELSLEPAGGPDGSGYLVLTDAANSQYGVVAIEPYTEVAQGSLLATFDINMAMGSQTPADGFSFNWGPDVPATVGGGDAEEGVGTGLSITFDVYGSDAPAVGIKYQGTFISNPIAPASIRPPDWAQVGIRVTQDGKVDVALNGIVYHHQVQLPDWSGIANGRFSVYARTGGLNQNHWIDNLIISTTDYAGPLVVTQQPVPQVVLAGQTATFAAAVNNPSGTTWSWESAPVGSDTFTPVLGATGPVYTTAALTVVDNGRLYRAVATNAAGSVTTEAVRLTVVDTALPDPDATLDFDNFSALSYLLTGSAFEEPSGGVEDSAVAKFTLDGMESQSGALLIDDYNAGELIHSLVAVFDVAVGKESEGAPADGFSFVWAPEVNTGIAPFGEEGMGNGLIVSFDTYLNANDNTGIAVRWKGEQIGEVVMTPAELTTFPDFVRTVIKVDADGTVDVWFGDRVIFHDLQLPVYQGLAGAGFGWGARTGGSTEHVWIDNISLTTAVAPPPAGGIEIRQVGGNIEVTFDGVLQESVTLQEGSWTDLPGQTSPYVFPVPASGVRFFRVK